MGTAATNIIQRVDQFTGVTVNYKKVTKWKDGSSMNDSKCDGVIYRKKDNEYYRLQYEFLDARMFGGANSDALQAAINYAGVGDTIVIIGKFNMTKKIAINKHITIAGQSNINANDTGSGINSTIKFTTALPVCIESTGGVTFKNLTISGISLSTEIGIKSTGAAVQIEGCVIQLFGTAIHVTNGYYNKIVNSVIAYAKQQIYFKSCFNATIANCNLNSRSQGWEDTDSIAVRLIDGTFCRFFGCSIEVFKQTGILLENNSTVHLYSTYFEASTTGIIPNNCIHIKQNCRVTAIGCHVYLTRNASTSFMNFDADMYRCYVYSKNNLIIYPTDDWPCVVYKFNNTSLNYFNNYSIEIKGDNWPTAPDPATSYMSITSDSINPYKGFFDIVFPVDHPEFTRSLLSAQSREMPSVHVNTPISSPFEGQIARFRNSSGYPGDNPLGLPVGTRYFAIYLNGGWKRYNPVAASQPNSAATDVAGLVADFNALLAKLKASGVMIT
ncbi:MAG: hypothetical protein QM594_02525 [Niabella sp.]